MSSFDCEVESNVTYNRMQEKKPAAKKQKASPARKQKVDPAEEKEKAVKKSEEDPWVPEDQELWDTIYSICIKADLSTLTLRMVRPSPLIESSG
jgi:hypothetical protein